MSKPEAPAISGAKSHGRTVCVACKIPIGLKLQLQHPQESPVPTGRGGEMVIDKRMVFGGPHYDVRGPAIPANGGVPEGYEMPPDIKGGYAFTKGIPADFWEQWLEQNKRADYVTSGMIFACPDMASAKTKAVEQKALKSGLEPLSRDRDEQGRLKDPRIPKPLNANVGRISFDAERAAQQRE